LGVRQGRRAADAADTGGRNLDAEVSRVGTNESSPIKA
jgi:hypothetical protein